MKSLFLILSFIAGLNLLWLWSSETEKSQRRLQEAEQSLHQAFLELPISEMQWYGLLQELENKKNLNAEEKFLLLSLRRLSESFQVRNFTEDKQ